MFRRCLRPHLVRSLRCRGFSNVKYETDAYGIPIRPTWSVNELLSSYPKPTLSSTTLARLHELSALIPPSEGTPEHTKLKEEMEDLVRLVEAVKLVDTTSVQPREQHAITEQQFNQSTPSGQDQEASGEALLHHAARVSGSFYVVDADKRR